MGGFFRTTFGCFGAIFGTLLGAIAGYEAVLARYATPTSPLTSGSALTAVALDGSLLGAVLGLVLGAVGFSWILSRIWPNEQHKQAKPDVPPITKP